MTAPRKLAINSDCSGKHAGMLAASRAQGWPLETYRAPDHPLQQRVLAAVLAATGLPDVRVGVDGCGVPVHGFTLSAMARVYATLALPERFGDDLEPAAERAVAAMRAEPYLVAGRNRIDTAVIQRTGGAVIVKAGAEGMMCASARDRRVGIAIKVRDGSRRATAPAMVALLRHLSLLSDEDVEALRPFARPGVLGGGEPVGGLETHVELAPAG